MSKRIAYYDSVPSTPPLAFFDSVQAEDYVARGVAWAIRSKSGRIQKLYRRPKERIFESAAHAVAVMRNNANQFVERERIGVLKVFKFKPIQPLQPLLDNTRELTRKDYLKMTATQKLLLNGPEVAAILGISAPMAYRIMADGTLPVIRIGRAVRVSPDALQEWIAARTTGTRTEAHEAGAAQ